MKPIRLLSDEMKPIRLLSGEMKLLVLKLIRFYQKAHVFHLPIFRAFFLSDAVCRFQPTCAEYTYQAIKTYGIMRGSWLGLKRIIHCHPWHPGGLDPLPLK